MDITAILIISFVCVLIIGNIMDAKPDIAQNDIEQLRMIARKMQFIPKLIQIPLWLDNQTKTEQTPKLHYDYRKKTTPFIAVYTLVNDNWQLPKADFWVQNNQLFFVSQDTISAQKTYLQRQINKKLEHIKQLDKKYFADDLVDIAPFISGISFWSNSISVYIWDEKWSKYIREYARKQYPTSDESVDIFCDKLSSQFAILKSTLYDWAAFSQEKTSEYTKIH